MDKTQQVAQLRLAADLLETGHPWETSHTGDRWWSATPSDNPAIHVVNNQYIRPVLASPSDGRPLRNEDELTAEQVGAGYRLTIKEDVFSDAAEVWNSARKEWRETSTKSFDSVYTYRLPLHVPWPEAPDPYAELKEAHAAGKMIQVRPKVRTKDWHDEWQDCIPTWGDDYEYRIKPTPTFQLPPPPPGMCWHREDGWEEGDLPQGWRSLVDGERLQAGDAVRWPPDTRYEIVEGLDGEFPLNPATSFYRTRRLLTFEHAGKQWTWHRPGDPMPCDGEAKIRVLTVGLSFWTTQGKDLSWANDQGNARIIGWRYADEKKTVPLGPEDVKPFTVIRRKGEAQTWHWRTVSYVDAVKVTCGNRGYGWIELASSYERNESLPLTGKWNPSAWEPCSKPA